jgi:type IV pilus assembly protein PilE
VKDVFRGAAPRARQGAGFTLIEMMVVVAILAIVAAIAYPTYMDHVRKGHRAAAQAFLVEVASREQQYLLDARNYAVGSAALTALNVSVPAEVSNFYSVTVDPAAPAIPPTFRLTATPLSGSMQASDGVIVLDQDGTRTYNGKPW